MFWNGWPDVPDLVWLDSGKESVGTFWHVGILVERGRSPFVQLPGGPHPCNCALLRIYQSFASEFILYKDLVKAVNKTHG